MPALTYTVLRSIVRVPFNVAAKTDISVSSSGSPLVNTFSSVAGDFAGLNSGEWVFTEGFTNSENNGWHQLSVNSTSTLITVTSTLVTELAGITVNVVGYLYGLNESVSKDIRVMIDNRQKGVVKTEARSLDGTIETLTDKRNTFYNITTGVLIPDDYKFIIQFLDSCESGETFTWDRDGTLATPDNALAAYLDSNGYVEERLENIVDRRISFRIRLA